jgi:protein SCO1
MKTKALLTAVIVVLGALLVWLTVFWEPITPKRVAEVPTHNRLAAGGQAPGGDFTLQGPDGPVSLKDFRGKVVLLYFGYTFCPDVCPTSLSLMARALSALTPAEQERVQGIFVSVDPERDTLKILKEYAPFFHPRIVGITGTPEQVASVARLYGASYAKQAPNAEGLYTVDHSSVTYVVDREGKLASSLPHAASVPQIVEAVRPLLAVKAGK